MTGLQRLYAAKYGTAEEKRAAADPKVQQEKIAAAEGGKIASVGFWDELGKLVEHDQAVLKEAVEKDKSTHPVKRFLSHPASLATFGAGSGVYMGDALTQLLNGMNASPKARVFGAGLGALGVGGLSVAEGAWHRRNAANRAAKGEKAHFLNTTGKFWDQTLVGRRNAGTEADFEKEKGGKTASGSFWDELERLVAADQAALKK